MVELQIKTEPLPERCEICHQADCFDAGKNFCSRCGELIGSRNILVKGKIIPAKRGLSGLWELAKLILYCRLP
jgi:hypothetical protein